MKKPKTPKLEVFKNIHGDWMFHLKAKNGEILASGESYKRKSGAIKGAEGLKRNAAAAEIVVEDV